jgi:hypothetical protein
LLIIRWNQSQQADSISEAKTLPSVQLLLAILLVLSLHQPEICNEVIALEIQVEWLGLFPFLFFPPYFVGTV